MDDRYQKQQPQSQAPQLYQIQRPLTKKDWIRYLVSKFQTDAELIAILVKEGAVKLPPSSSDYDFITRFMRVCFNKDLLFWILSKMKKRDLDNLVQAVRNKTKTKLQKWIYTKIMNFINEGKKISVNLITGEAIGVFKLNYEKDWKSVKAEVIRIRNRIYKRLYRYRKRQQAANSSQQKNNLEQ
jgi:hypothetical protein